MSRPPLPPLPPVTPDAAENGKAEGAASGRRFVSDVAFSPSVKAVQARKGSRGSYARMEQGHGWRTEVDEDLSDFLAERDSAFLATASAEGQPYVQHRGGPAGFIRVLDAHTLAFAEFDGNRQFITQGNLEENPRAQLFVIDHATRRRVKVWGRARIVEGDQALIARLMPAGYAARATGVLVFDVHAWDANCPKHIPLKFDAADVQAALDARDARIAELEAQLRAAQARPA